MQKAKVYPAHTRACPLCGSARVYLLYKATSKIPSSSKQIQVSEKHFGLHGDIVRCDQCGFTYVGNKEYVNKVLKLYTHMSDEAYLQEEKERRHSFIRILSMIEKSLHGRKVRILDIGCCTGGLLVEARKRGWDVYGIDPSVWACKVAKKANKLEIFNGSIESYKKSLPTFDAITILDVLEHVENPKTIINKTYKLLRKGGILCVVTPNYGSITAKILEKRWWGIRLAHLSYFRKSDISKLLMESKFKIVHMRQYIRYFSLYYLIIRLIPSIEKWNNLKKVLKHCTIPLLLFDTFELYFMK